MLEQFRGIQDEQKRRELTASQLEIPPQFKLSSNLGLHAPAPVRARERAQAGRQPPTSGPASAGGARDGEACRENGR